MNAAAATELTRYDEACRALSEAKTIDAAKNIRDVGIALQLYARQAKNRELEMDALELRLSATRRIGQLIRGQAETVGLQTGGDAARIARGLQNPEEAPPTLEAQGIDKNLAKQARILGAIGDESFATLIAQSRDAIRQAGSKVIRRTSEREGVDAQIAPDVRAKVKGTPLDAAPEREYLATLTEDEQRAVIAELMNDEVPEPDEIELMQLTELVTAYNVASDKVRRIFHDRQLGTLGEAHSFGELTILIDKARKRRGWSMEELNARAGLAERHANKLLVRNPASPARKRLGPKSAVRMMRALGATMQLKLGALPDDADRQG